MATSFATKRRDTLNRFYTRTAVGELLADQLAGFHPRNVIDMGAGEGSLSASVARRWTDASIVTVDVDVTIMERLHENLEGAGACAHRHHVHDVFDPMLPSVIEEHGQFDLAVCNPPFFRPTWNRDFARILQHADLADGCSSTSEVTAEILFLAQNLRILRDGGKVALIAPDGLLTGARTAQFRRAIMDRHTIDCVMQLPKHSFHDTEARCFILILTKNTGPTENVKLLRYSTSGGVQAPIVIDRAQAEQRMDFEFHSTRSACAGRIATLRQLGAEIKRGSVDTIARKAANFPTFHTTDYRYLDEGMIAVEVAGELPAGRRFVVAEPGDILLARVDRNLHRKVGIVVRGRVPVTDCIYRVRVPIEHQQSVFRALRSPSGAASLLSVTKGVSARLLGKADLLDMPLQLADG